MKFLLYSLLLLSLAGHVAASTPSPPFSAGALRYLLDRHEYERFDWYVGCYLKRYPDTAVLYLLQGDRHFEEARARALQAPADSAGLDPTLMRKAFEAMDRARHIEPVRRDIHLAVCRMAAEAGFSETLAREVALAGERFGCDRPIALLAFDYALAREPIEDTATTARLIAAVVAVCPELEGLQGEAGRLAWSRGEEDNAAAHFARALASAPSDTVLLRRAHALAAARGEYAEACDLALRRHRTSGDLVDLEQAAVCAAAFDTLRARAIYGRVQRSAGFVDSLSAARWFFEEALKQPLSRPRQAFFAGSLVHLNFPLFQIDFDRNRDLAALHLHRTRAYYRRAACEAAVNGAYAERAFGAQAPHERTDSPGYDRAGPLLAGEPHAGGPAARQLASAYGQFDEAMVTGDHEYRRVMGRTGGIPRKYPAEIVEPYSRTAECVRPAIDRRALQDAFGAMEQARDTDPARRETYLEICRMACEAGEGKLLAAALTDLTTRFGTSSDLVDLALSFVRDLTAADDAESGIAVLRVVAGSAADRAAIDAEMGRLFGNLGELDSASVYMSRAVRESPEDLQVLRNSITLAAVRSDFRGACDLAVRRHALSHELKDLEQAVVFAFVYDTSRAWDLYARLRDCPGYTAPTSAARWFIEEATVCSLELVEPRFFSGDLFHLNFALFAADYRNSQNRPAYYLHKASAFYVYGVHDSAAYYNLNVLRNVERGDNRLGYTALYNLAAEYYAAGKHRLSYDRFLNLYRYGSGWHDVAVRYALGVNYEQFGDLGRARSHYRYVLRHPDGHYDQYYNLNELASYRLERLSGRRRMEIVR